MIKAKELRIGNYIQVGGNTIDTYQTYKPNKVTAYVINAIAEENEERSDDYILSVWQPIKLNPEILEKCGFENNNTDDSGLSFNKRIDNWLCIEILISDFSTSFYDTDENFDTGNYLTPNTKTKYLHQLQNLFFALTGEELQVNL